MNPGKITSSAREMYSSTKKKNFNTLKIIGKGRAQLVTTNVMLDCKTTCRKKRQKQKVEEGAQNIVKKQKNINGFLEQWRNFWHI